MVLRKFAREILVRSALFGWRIYDALTKKRSNYWVFPTHYIHTDRFTENSRAMFEHVKADPLIRKIVFYRGSTISFSFEDAVNFEVVRHGSLRSLYLLARAKVIFLNNSIAMDFSLRWSDGRFSILKISQTNRVVVNLWHGIPLKKLFYAANGATGAHLDRVAYRREERLGYAGLIASSDIDSYAMASAFYPLNYQQVWLTGLPRNDFLTKPEHLLPQYIRSSVSCLRTLKGGRRLIVYAPTYRQTSAVSEAFYYQFSTDEIDSLRSLLVNSNCVFGFRPHYFKNSDKYFNFADYIDNDIIFDLSQKKISEFSAIAREMDVLITDYSSVYMEAIYLNKKVVSFAYDLESYKSEQDGLLYDLELAFPGPVCRSFSQLLIVLEDIIDGRVTERNETAKRMFFKYDDCGNSHRVYSRINELLD